eukprot:1009093-Pelagomonas_calceolata.AAC.2
MGARRCHAHSAQLAGMQVQDVQLKMTNRVMPAVILHRSDALGMGERIVLPSSPTVLKLMRMLQPEFEAALDAKLRMSKAVGVTKRAQTTTPVHYTMQALMKRKMMELDEAEDRLASVLWWNFLKKQQAKRASESKREELASLKRQGRHGGPSHWKVEDS